jgi:hypothetical protein
VIPRVFERIDHAGYVARDLNAGIAALSRPYDLQLTVEFELPQFSLRGAFLSAGTGAVEVVEFTDATLADSRLGGLDVRLDHVAYEVADIEHAAQRLRNLGARFCGPDGSAVVHPVEIAGSRHLWTFPGTAPGVCMQLIQRG